MTPPVEQTADPVEKLAQKLVMIASGPLSFGRQTLKETKIAEELRIFLADHEKQVVEMTRQEMWEECVDATCDLCREFGWPINNERGELFHFHDTWEGTKPCKAEVLMRMKRLSSSVASEREQP